MKRQQRIVMEVRDRSSVRHPTSIGARVEAQFPHEVYKIHKPLDRDNEWRNLMLWQAAERLRQDFEASDLQAEVWCATFWRS
jgi:hypothetical protein